MKTEAEKKGRRKGMGKAKAEPKNHFLSEPDIKFGNPKYADFLSHPL